MAVNRRCDVHYHTYWRHEGYISNNLETEPVLDDWTGSVNVKDANPPDYEHFDDRIESDFSHVKKTGHGDV